MVVAGAAVLSGLAGCMLEGEHDLTAVQSSVYPLDLNELNTYISGDAVITIKRTPGGYEMAGDWTRPDKSGALAFDLVDTRDRRGWLGQFKEYKDGKRVYTYFFADKLPQRLEVRFLTDDKLIERTDELKRSFSAGKLVARSPQEAYAVLQRFVQLKALTGGEYVAPDIAVAQATAELTKDRTNASAYLKRATAWHVKGEHGRAVIDLTAVIRTSTDRDTVTKAHYRRGLAHRAAKSFDLAIADFTQAISREREDASKRSAANRSASHLLMDTFYARALTWQQAGDTERAIAGFGETIGSDPDANDAYHQRGLARQARGDLPGAMGDFAEALRIKPDDAQALAALGAARNQAAAPARALTVPALVAGEKRVALVIGNAAYRHAARLTNPLNDAQDVAKALRELGFETIVATDLDWAGMNAAMERFSRVVAGADVALLYYAGHGMQWANRNYLLPVDARIADVSDVNRFRLLPLEDVLEVMSAASRVRLVLLDACRNNPMEEEFKLRVASQPGANRDAAVSRGLVRAPASRGWVIAYATQANMVASDGLSRNSPFTAAFLKHVGAPDLDVKSMLFRVQEEVDRTTNRAQLPELSISLVGEYKLRPGSR